MKDPGEEGGVRKILVIEDDRDYRNLLKTYLTKYLPGVEIVEYDPVSRGAPPENFDWCPYDVLILDYYLCIYGLTGLDLLQKHWKKPGFPAALMITGAGDEEVAIRALNFGVYEYLRKEELTREKLVESVNNAYNKHRKDQVNIREQKKLNKTFDKTLFYRELEHPSSTPGENKTRVLILINVDNMNDLASEFGFIVHDNLLRHIARLSYEKLYPVYSELYITRVSGSSIAVLIIQPHRKDELEKEMRDLTDYFRQNTYLSGNKPVPCTVISGALYIDDEETPATLLIKAAGQVCEIARQSPGKTAYIISLNDLRTNKHQLQEKSLPKEKPAHLEKDNKQEADVYKHGEDERRQLEEERQRLAEEKRKLEAEEQKRLSELQRREEEEKRKEEEEKRKLQDERRQLEEERQRLIEEKRKLEAEEQKRLSELRQREAEDERKEEEDRRKLEEERQRLESERQRLAEEKRKLEEEEQKRLKELQLREAEEMRKEKEQRRKLEEERQQLMEEKRKLQEEEQKRLKVIQQREVEEKRKEGERLREIESIRKKLENERQRLEEEKSLQAKKEKLRILEAEKRRKAEEEKLRRLEIERQRKEAEAKQRAEEQQKRLEEHKRLVAEKKEKLRQAEEERKRKEAKLRRLEEESRKAEERRKLEVETRRKEEERLRQEEEVIRKTEKKEDQAAAEKRNRETSTVEPEKASSEDGILSFPLDVSVPPEAGLSIDQLMRRIEEEKKQSEVQKLKKVVQQPQKDTDGEQKASGPERITINASDETDANTTEADAYALEIQEAFNDNRAIQTFQPVIAMFSPEKGNAVALYRVGIQVIDSNGRITTGDEIKTRNTRLHMQQFIDHWLLRETVGRIVNNVVLQTGRMFIISISDAWLKDITLFNWLNKLLKGQEKIRPGKNIALEIPVSMLTGHMKRALPLVNALKKNWGFRIALGDIKSTDEISRFTGIIGFDFYIINYNFAGELATAAEGKLIESIKSKGARVVVDGIEDSSMLTKAISHGADYVMGRFIGGPETFITGTGNIESLDLI